MRERGSDVVAVQAEGDRELQIVEVRLLVGVYSG
jgi:hypothetical protein